MNTIWIVPPDSKGGFDGRYMGLDYVDLHQLATGLLHEVPELRGGPGIISREFEIEMAKLIGVYNRVIRQGEHNPREHRPKARDTDEYVQMHSTVLTWWLSDPEIQKTLDFALRIGQDGYVQLPERPSEPAKCGWLKAPTADERNVITMHDKRITIVDGSHRNRRQ
jgi:hypothetical protein